MRTWERTRVAEHCGQCGTVQAAETPVLVIALPALEQGRRRIRCQSCAGEEPNLDQLEAFDVAGERQQISEPGRFSRFEFSGVTRNLFDGRAAALPTGDRE